MTNSSRQNWVVARDRIQARMAELRLSVADLARASGLSDKHLRTLLNGDDVSIPRDQTRWALCDALRWTPDSIDRILDGDEPLEVEDESGEVSRLARIDGRLEEIAAVQMSGLSSLKHQQTEMSKFWKAHRQLEDAVRSVEADLRARLAAVEKELAELRQAQHRDDAGQP